MGMEKVKELVNDLDVKPENFCDQCVMASKAICKTRREFLQNRYGTPVNEAVNVVVREDPVCFKKDSNDIQPKDQFDDDGHVNYLHKQYNLPEQEAMDAVVNQDPVCLKKNK